MSLFEKLKKAVAYKNELRPQLTGEQIFNAFEEAFFPTAKSEWKDSSYQKQYNDIATKLNSGKP
jgi:hypothetical protein